MHKLDELLQLLSNVKENLISSPVADRQACIALTNAVILVMQRVMNLEAMLVAVPVDLTDPEELPQESTILVTGQNGSGNGR